MRLFVRSRAISLSLENEGCRSYFYKNSRIAYLSVLFLFVLTFGYSQQTFGIANKEYETLLERIEKKDTLIHAITKYYKCSEALSGRIDYYYEKENLKLINHFYKQGFTNIWTSEDYFIKKDTLKIKTSIIEEVTHLNWGYKENPQGESSTSLEKVIQVIDQRMFFKSNLTTICFERKHEKNALDWDKDYFNSLALQKGSCLEDNEDIRYKYKLLRKAEKKLVGGYSQRKNQCIFYIW